MEPKEVLDELKTILVTRLKFDPRRAAEVTEDTALPKGVEGSIGLDSLDFIELSHRDRGAVRPRPWTSRRISAALRLPRHAVALHRRAARRRMRRVVVTGLGAVSPFGAGVKAYWAGIAAGVCAIRPITLIDTDGFPVRSGR